jgi:hypothetical protein
MWKRLVILVDATYSRDSVMPLIRIHLDFLQNESILWVILLLSSSYLIYVGITFYSYGTKILIRYVFNSDKVFEEVKLIVCGKL